MYGTKTNKILHFTISLCIVKCNMCCLIFHLNHNDLKKEERKKNDRQRERERTRDMERKIKPWPGLLRILCVWIERKLFNYCENNDNSKRISKNILTTCFHYNLHIPSDRVTRYSVLVLHPMSVLTHWLTFMNWIEVIDRLRRELKKKRGNNERKNQNHLNKWARKLNPFKYE